MRSGSLLALAAGVFFLGIAATPGGQDAGDQTRHIIAEEFLKARPPVAKPSPSPKPTYSPADAKAKVKAAGATLDLGITLWRLRPSAPSEDAARLLVQDAGAELTAERIDMGTTLAIGDRVRLTLESPAAGFLYVSDREVYSDGKMSEPYLIFPTTRTRGGDNAVRGGKLIDIPDQRDRPNYFTVRPSRPGQIGEQLTIIVAATALKEVSITDKVAQLSNASVDSWQKSWAAPVQKFVQNGGKLAWTRQEQSAAADGTRLLTQDDPAPQTIFRVPARKGVPLLVNVTLPYAAADR
jgi:hypothetical protein